MDSNEIINIALDDFNLNKNIYSKMKKTDLKIYLKRILDTNIDKRLLLSAKILLDNKKKVVRFSEKEKKNNIYSYSLFQNIDLLIDSSWNNISSSSY